MPVTARLSQKFYERFGDEIAGEFVDWFNAVDATYQQQLRELNDLNWERFKAELHAAIAQLEARLGEKIAQSEARSDDKIAQLEVRIDGKLGHLDGKIGQLDGKIGSVERLIGTKHSETMKWMFVYWSGTVLSLGGLMVLLLRK